MRILLVCTEGQNRSKYLAGYLKEKGYEVDYGGVRQDGMNPLKQEQIDRADMIIAVREHIKDKLLERYDCAGKKVVHLEVKDNPARYTEEARALAESEWNAFQEKYVYTELRKQVDKILR